MKTARNLFLVLILSLTSWHGAMAQTAADAVVDQAGGAPLTASTEPGIGQLFPLSETLMVDFERGRVGINKVSPDTNLFVYGNQRIWCNRTLRSPHQPGADWVSGGLQYANLSYTRGWCADASGFQSAGGPLELNALGEFGVDIANTLYVNADGHVGVGGEPGGGFHLDVTGVIRASDTIVTTKPWGAPFQVASTDVTPNLNADMLDGYHVEDIIAEARAGMVTGGRSNAKSGPGQHSTTDGRASGPTSDIPLASVAFENFSNLSGRHFILDGSSIAFGMHVREVPNDYGVFERRPNESYCDEVTLTQVFGANTSSPISAWYQEIVADGVVERRNGVLAIDTQAGQALITLQRAVPVSVERSFRSGVFTETTRFMVDGVSFSGVSSPLATQVTMAHASQVSIAAVDVEIEPKQVEITENQHGGAQIMAMNAGTTSPYSIGAPEVGDVHLRGVGLQHFIETVQPLMQQLRTDPLNFPAGESVIAASTSVVIARTDDAWPKHVSGLSLRASVNGTVLSFDTVTFSIDDYQTD